MSDLVVSLPSTLEDYADLDADIARMSEVDRWHTLRVMGVDDLYFLLSRILSTADWPHPNGEKGRTLWDDEWILARCRECQFENRQVVKVWARGHGKSTIDTFGGLIRLGLEDPNITIGIFSITGKVAKSFLYQIKQELEGNDLLKHLYPDKLYADPQSKTQGSPKWSLIDGLTLKRERNWKNATYEAHGLVDGNYTGGRYKVRHFDDMVNEKTVGSPEMIQKAIKGFSFAQACRAPQGWSQIVGTFYGNHDPYTHLCRNMGYDYSVHGCYEIDWDQVEYDDHTGFFKKLYHNFDKPVLFSQSEIDEAKRDVGEEFGIQYLCDPSYAVEQNFSEDWLRYYSELPGKVRVGMTVYIMVDPAHARKKDSDYTCMWVVGLGWDGNYYLLDGVRAKMNLADRTDKLFQLVSRWRPLHVRYEHYGMQADVEHIKGEMDRRVYHFPIVEVGGSTAKVDRIKRLIPHFKAGRIWFPQTGIDHFDFEGRRHNLVDVFIREEYRDFPSPEHDDMLDALSRLFEPGIVNHFPAPRHDKADGDIYTIEARRMELEASAAGTWMG